MGDGLTHQPAHPVLSGIFWSVETTNPQSNLSDAVSMKVRGIGLRSWKHIINWFQVSSTLHEDVCQWFRICMNCSGKHVMGLRGESPWHHRSYRSAISRSRSCERRPPLEKTGLCAGVSLWTVLVLAVVVAVRVSVVFSGVGVVVCLFLGLFVCLLLSFFCLFVTVVAAVSCF